MGHLGGITELLEGAPESELRRQLVGLAGEAAQLAGWLAIDMRQHVVARVYLNLGVDAAREADDKALLSFVLGNIGHALSAGGRPAEALHFLEDAQHLAERFATATTRSWLAAVEGHAQATLGNAAACRAALKRAQAAIDEAQPAADPAWIYFFNQAQLDHWAGYAHLRLRQFDDAQAALQRSFEALAPSFARERAVTQADLAEAYVRRGDYVEGCRLAGVALITTHAAGSTRGVQRIRALRPHLRRWNHTDEVKGLDELLRRFAA